MERSTFNTLVIIWITLAVAVFVALLFVTAPYGRHSSKKWGVTIPNNLGWFFMEIPALTIFLILVFTGRKGISIPVAVISALFAAHYINRALIYPLRIRTKGKVMPLAVVFMAVAFNSVNTGFIGYYTGTLQSRYTNDWLTDPRFITGVLVFLAGMTINIMSDEKLIHLRRTTQNGYSIPSGGLFRFVSCPNFFGELVEWAGFAMLCWSLPSLSFFVWTFCNLVPRALDHHKWYKSYFPDYPQDRKAVIPFVL